jgi:hypothetical protein
MLRESIDVLYLFTRMSQSLFEGPKRAPGVEGFRLPKMEIYLNNAKHKLY